MKTRRKLCSYPNLEVKARNFARFRSWTCGCLEETPRIDRGLRNRSLVNEVPTLWQQNCRNNDKVGYSFPSLNKRIGSYENFF